MRDVDVASTSRGRAPGLRTAAGQLRPWKRWCATEPAGV